ncbi:MAG: hypothetical protein ACREJ6_13625 [Candidatus Methylomirabilis sp.]
MEKYVAQILFLVGLAVWIGWVIVRRYLSVDVQPSAKVGEPPSDAMLRSYFKEMQQDLSLLTVTNFAILLVLVFALVLKL